MKRKTHKHLEMAIATSYHGGSSPHQLGVVTCFWIQPARKFFVLAISTSLKEV